MKILRFVNWRQKTQLKTENRGDICFWTTAKSRTADLLIFISGSLDSDSLVVAFNFWLKIFGGSLMYRSSDIMTSLAGATHQEPTSWNFHNI